MTSSLLLRTQTSSRRDTSALSKASLLAGETSADGSGGAPRCRTLWMEAAGGVGGPDRAVRRVPLRPGSTRARPRARAAAPRAEGFRPADAAARAAAEGRV